VAAQKAALEMCGIDGEGHARIPGQQLALNHLDSLVGTPRRGPDSQGSRRSANCRKFDDPFDTSTL